MRCEQRLGAVLLILMQPRTRSRCSTRSWPHGAKRSLTTVIDTLGLDPERRADYRRLAREAGLPAVLVIMNTAAALCRERNRRARPAGPGPDPHRSAAQDQQASRGCPR